MNNTKNILLKGLNEDVFPCYSAWISKDDEILFQEAKGYAQLYPDKVPVDKDTLFDMASLTKVMCTTILTMKLMEMGELSLSDKLSRFFDAPEDKRGITIGHLLTHTSGLMPHLDFFNSKTPYDQVESVIFSSILCAPLGERVIYSDNGFILLGKICEMITGMDLDALGKAWIYEPLGMTHTSFYPQGDNIAATEYDPTTESYVKGIVHDDNARNFGKPCGHAGLFSTVGDVATFCAMLLNGGRPLLSDAAYTLMTRNHTPNLNIARTLGFCYQDGRDFFGGDFVSLSSFGHTGFTGTSICIDPVERAFAILLTNRVHPTRDNRKILSYRPRFHNAVWADITE